MKDTALTRIRFLLEHKALFNFYAECTVNPWWLLNRHISTKDSLCSFIGKAFIWENSKQGHDYWLDLGIKYVERVNKNKLQ